VAAQQDLDLTADRQRQRLDAPAALGRGGSQQGLDLTGPYRFVNREFVVITYRTDPEKLRAVVPEPLQIDEPLVKFEFIRMPDSTGFGS
jgi:Acetoacetate decarboxylase (ADC)